MARPGRGQVTWHFPLDGQGPTTLEREAPKGRVSLTTSYQLDDAPGFERFFLVTGPDPIDLEAVRFAANYLAQSDSDPAASRLRPPANLRQTSVLLKKEDHP